MEWFLYALSNEYIKVYAVNLGILFLFSILLTYLSGKISAKTLYYKNWLFKQRKWEKNGYFYRNLLKVKRWKTYLPELSDYIRLIFPKKHISSFNRDYLQSYLMESCKSELTHWFIIVSSLLFSFWSDSTMFFTLFCTACALNLPYIVIQRYNRPRIIRVLEHFNGEMELEQSEHTLSI